MPPPASRSSRPSAYLTTIRFGGQCWACPARLKPGDRGWYDPQARRVACASHDVAAGTPTAVVEEAQVLPKLIRARYDSSCTACGDPVLKGTEVFWVPGTKVVVCVACTADEAAAGIDNSPGRAATRFADEAIRRHSEALLAAFPVLGEHLARNAELSREVHAWVRGADGERGVGSRLDALAAQGRIEVLHDRLLPSGGNIDHLVIGPRRIGVVDAKHYRGARISKADGVLMVADRPAEHLIDGVRHQAAAVRAALGVDPASANVCAGLAFVGCTFGFSDLLSQRQVWCGTAHQVVSTMAWRGPILIGGSVKLDGERRREVAELLAAAFPPAR